MASGTIKCNRKTLTNFSPSNLSQSNHCYYVIEGNLMLISIIGVTDLASETQDVPLASNFSTTFGRNMAGRAYSYIWNSAGIDIQLLAKDNHLSLSSNTNIPNGINIYGQLIVPIT